jgi:hypothetical protein
MSIQEVLELGYRSSGNTSAMARRSSQATNQVSLQCFVEPQRIRTLGGYGQQARTHPDEDPSTPILQAYDDSGEYDASELPDPLRTRRTGPVFGTEEELLGDARRHTMQGVVDTERVVPRCQTEFGHDTSLGPPSTMFAS